MEVKQHPKKENKLYRWFYFCGAKIIINLNRAKRRIKRLVVSGLRYIYIKFLKKKIELQRQTAPKVFQAKVNITLAKRAWNIYKQKPIKQQLITGFRLVVKHKGTFLNYCSPILACIVLIGCVDYFNNRTWALSVEYDGQIVGFVQNESDYYSAKKMVTDRIINEEYKESENSAVKFSLLAVEPEMISNSFELSNQIIRASDNEIALASGLYVDDKFLGAVTDHQILLDEMTSLLEPYREENPDAKIAFSNKIQLKEGLFPLTSIVDTSVIAETITSQAMGESSYTVVSGDSPWVIASKNNIPYTQLLRLNPTIEKTLLPGQELTIQGAKPFLDIKLIKKEVYTEDIPFETTRVNNSSLIKGQTSISKDGVKGIREITAEVTYVNGSAVDTNVIETRVVQEPSDQIMQVGTNTLSSSSDTAFIWPTQGRISCGWYGYAGHTAIDIANSYGTPIRAAASGTVSLVRHSYTGYGRHVMINHGSGVETLYAHNSQIIVSPGQKVAQGEIIAYMGSTGNSSGNHCHFEIRINGRFVNPTNYLP